MGDIIEAGLQEMFPFVLSGTITGRFSPKDSYETKEKVPVTAEEMFDCNGPFEIPIEQLTEEEMRLMLRDLRSIKVNELLHGTKE